MEFKEEKNRVWLPGENGEMLAEATFPDEKPGVVNLNHTFVDPSLRGQGIAGRLVAAAADKLRREGKKVRPTCPYAVDWFQKHPEYSDLLAK